MKKTNTYSGTLIATLMAAAALLTAPLARAQTTYTWTNGDPGNSNFTDADNWSPSGGPPLTNLDSVIFNSPTPLNWNTSINLVSATFTAGGWDVNIIGRTYINNLDFSGANLGTIEFSQTSGSQRFGNNGSGGTWEIGTGNILHVSSIDRFELSQPVTKTGAGTFLLTQSNIGGGNRGMDIDQGTVILNSTNTPNTTNSPWSVAAGATLGGNGGIRSNATNVNGIADVFGTLQAGGSGNITDGQSNVVDAGSQFGSFSVDYTGNATRGLYMQDGSNLVIQFSSDSSQNSQINMLGGLFDIGTGVTLDLVGPGAIDPGTYTLLSFDPGDVDLGDAAGTYAGTFGDLQLNGSSAGSDYSLSYNANSIDLVVIPEPGTLALALLAVGGLLLFRRKRS